MGLRLCLILGLLVLTGKPSNAQIELSEKELSSRLQLYQKTQKEWNDTSKLAPSKKQLLAEIRNEVVRHYLILIDEYYDQVEVSFLKQSALPNASLDIVQIGLSSAAKALEDDLTESFTSTIQTKLEMPSQVNQDLLKDRAIKIFVARMNANRAAYQELILRRLKSDDIEAYSLQEAILSLVECIHHSSLRNAMRQLQEEAAQAPQPQ